MPDMTDILTAHVPQGYGGDGNTYCPCKAWDSQNNTDVEYAAHVAAALENAGYGKVEGEKEWGVGATSTHAGWAEDSEHEAREVCRNIDRPLVSRTVSPWKKEA